MKPNPSELTRSRYKAIIRLLENTELTPKEIAKQVQCSIATVEAVNNHEIGRCPDCGGLVKFPCAGCAVHAGIVRDREIAELQDWKPRNAHGP